MMKTVLQSNQPIVIFLTCLPLERTRIYFVVLWDGELFTSHSSWATTSPLALSNFFTLVDCIITSIIFMRLVETWKNYYWMYRIYDNILITCLCQSLGYSELFQCCLKKFMWLKLRGIHFCHHLERSTSLVYESKGTGVQSKVTGGPLL